MRRKFRTAVWFGILLLAAVLGWLHYWTTRFDHIISMAAARNAVDVSLLKAIVYEESWFRPNIRGAAGEFGLMQISSAAARDFASRKGYTPFHETRLFEPELNVEIGAWYLKQSLERYRDAPQPTIFALLRYNAGEVRADNWLSIARSRSRPDGLSSEEFLLSVVDFPKTREYARRIIRRSRTRNFYF